MAMEQKNAQRKITFAALQHSYKQACNVVEFFAEEAVRYGLWDQANFGKRLSDLYLRLKQGPVRVIIMGQTSSGKSTLINALVGGIIAPESADACSPIPICFMKKDKEQTSQTLITYFERQRHKLPQEKYANQTSLLQWHHDSGTLAQDNGIRPFVHTTSETFPQLATLIDSPGLNANGTDTDKLYALFEQPSYANADDLDLPELVVYTSTSGGNLSEEEMESIKRLLDKGVDPHRIFVVHNEYCANLEDLPIDQFENTDNAARNGLAESLRALLPPKLPDVFHMDTNDSSALFGAFLENAIDNEASALSADDAEMHIVSLNALFARVFYAGAYDPLSNLITGSTKEQYDQLLAAKENPKQERVIELCAAWRQANHADYQPLLYLRDFINEQALNLEEAADLKSALRAVGRLGDELLKRRIQQLRDEFERERKPVREWGGRLDELRVWMSNFNDELPQRIAKWHEEHALKLNDLIREIAEKQEYRIHGVSASITEACTKTLPIKFKHWLIGDPVILADPPLPSPIFPLISLALGLISVLSPNWLRKKYDTLLENNPYFAAIENELVRNLKLLLAYREPAGGQDVFAALETVCKEMIVSINQAFLNPDDESIAAVQKLLKEYGDSLIAMLEEDATRVHQELSSCCQSMQEEACGKNRQLIDALMEQSFFSGAISARFEYRLNVNLPEQMVSCFDSIISVLREGMTNPIQEPEDIAEQIQQHYSTLGTQVPEVNIGNVRKLVFQQVICPILEQAAVNAVGRLDIEKVVAQADILSEIAGKCAEQAMEPVFLNGGKLIDQCEAVLKEAMKQWRDPEEDGEVKSLAKAITSFDQGLLELSMGHRERSC